MVVQSRSYFFPCAAPTPAAAMLDSVLGCALVCLFLYWRAFRSGGIQARDASALYASGCDLVLLLGARKAKCNTCTADMPWQAGTNP